MTHYERAETVLLLAVREATKNYTAAAGCLIRQRVESCLSTALAMCKEDPLVMYQLIDDARVQPDLESDNTGQTTDG